MKKVPLWRLSDYAEYKNMSLSNLYRIRKKNNIELVGKATGKQFTVKPFGDPTPQADLEMKVFDEKNRNDRIMYPLNYLEQQFKGFI